MKIEKAQAEKVLLNAAATAAPDEIDQKWATRLEAFSEMCKSESRTHIAFLGTALLAKAVNTRADAFSVKKRDGHGAPPGSYSARGVVGVLAARAKELGINIGVTGREPLNNQPYFGLDRLGRSVKVKAGSEDALLALCGILDDVNKIVSEEEARRILSTYIYIRRKFNPTYNLLKGAAALTPAQFAAVIATFVQKDSEGGKRAQAAAAGLFDVAIGERRVITTRINDPDRGFPGDIGLRASAKSETPEKVVEVRDKPVSDADIFHFAQKVHAAGLNDGAIVAAASLQHEINLVAGRAHGARFGIHLRFFVGWKQLVEDCFFWSECADAGAVTTAAERIYHRLIEAEVSAGGVDDWIASVKQATA